MEVFRWTIVTPSPGPRRRRGPTLPSRGEVETASPVSCPKCGLGEILDIAPEVLYLLYDDPPGAVRLRRDAGRFPCAQARLHGRRRRRPAGRACGARAS